MYIQTVSYKRKKCVFICMHYIHVVRSSAIFLNKLYEFETLYFDEYNDY